MESRPERTSIPGDVGPRTCWDPVRGPCLDTALSMIFGVAGWAVRSAVVAVAHAKRDAGRRRRGDGARAEPYVGQNVRSQGAIGWRDCDADFGGGG